MDSFYMKKDAILVSDAHESRSRDYLREFLILVYEEKIKTCLLYTSPSPRDRG